MQHMIPNIIFTISFHQPWQNHTNADWTFSLWYFDCSVLSLLSSPNNLGTHSLPKLPSDTTNQLYPDDPAHWICHFPKTTSPTYSPNSSCVSGVPNLWHDMWKRDLALLLYIWYCTHWRHNMHSNLKQLFLDGIDATFWFPLPTQFCIRVFFSFGLSIWFDNELSGSVCR
jgi:hypothetical protein